MLMVGVCAPLEWVPLEAVGDAGSDVSVGEDDGPDVVDPEEVGGPPLDAVELEPVCEAGSDVSVGEDDGPDMVDPEEVGGPPLDAVELEPVDGAGFDVSVGEDDGPEMVDPEEVEDQVGDAPLDAVEFLPGEFVASASSIPVPLGWEELVPEAVGGGTAPDEEGIWAVGPAVPVVGEDGASPLPESEQGSLSLPSSAADVLVGEGVAESGEFEGGVGMFMPEPEGMFMPEPEGMFMPEPEGMFMPEPEGMFMPEPEGMLIGVCMPLPESVQGSPPLPSSVVGVLVEGVPESGEFEAGGEGMAVHEEDQEPVHEAVPEVDEEVPLGTDEFEPEGSNATSILLVTVGWEELVPEVMEDPPPDAEGVCVAWSDLPSGEEVGIPCDGEGEEVWLLPGPDGKGGVVL
jgi:hypothetical protein